MGSRLSIPGFLTTSVLAAVLSLASTAPCAGQTLASFETSKLDETSYEVIAPLLDDSGDTALAWSQDLSATWQNQSGWRIGGFFYNPAEHDAASFGLSSTGSTDASFSFDLDHPSFLTAGLGYRDRDGWQFGAEVHFVEMVDTGGLDRQGYTTDIEALAIRWDSLPVVTLGGVIPLGDSLTLRSGFLWNRNQAQPLDFAFNAMAPGLLQSSFNVSLQWQWTSDLQWFLHYRSGLAQDFSNDAGVDFSSWEHDRVDGALDVISLTLGLEILL